MMYFLLIIKLCDELPTNGLHNQSSMLCSFEVKNLQSFGRQDDVSVNLHRLPSKTWPYLGTDCLITLKPHSEKK